MTADIVNLRQHRKAKARTDKEKQAAENRAKFGRPKAERVLIDERQKLEAKRLDGHKTRDERDDKS